jgi:hypothetical protein
MNQARFLEGVRQKSTSPKAQYFKGHPAPPQALPKPATPFITMAQNPHGGSGEHMIALPPSLQAFLTQNVFEVVIQKSIPTQIRQFILYISNRKR